LCGLSGLVKEEMMNDTLRLEDYTVDLEQETDGSYVAEVVEMPGCLAAGADPNEAVSMLRDSFVLWVEETVASGRPVPAPARSGPNGRILLRLPKSLHVRAAQAAARDGVSVNAFVTAAVAERVGAEADRAGGLGHGHVRGAAH
jgi:predicted RNase H-like HicB family nuclease